MIYSKDDIKLVLWNSFTNFAKDIKFLEQVGEQYWYEILLEEDMTLDKLNDIGQDLEESQIFDIINKGPNKLLVKYIGEDGVMDFDEMKEFINKINKNIQK